MRTSLQVLALGLVALPLIGGAAGCNRKGQFSPVDMWNRSRVKTYESVDFFPDRTAYRPITPGTVARGQMFKADDEVYRGIGADGRFVSAIPASILQDYASSDKDKMSPERNLLARGQERYQIYCSMCHGYSGHGDGMVVRRGFVPPPDYRIKRLRDAPVGHFYDVIANGYGAMYSYASRVPVQDRWAIAAYIRRLQEVQPQVVPDVRYDSNSKDGRGKGTRSMYGAGGMLNAAPRTTDSTVGTAENPGSGSQVRQGAGMPQPKNPMQALPQPGAAATPGLEER